jgi:hypothetical protein
VANPFRGGFRVVITGPEGFERTKTFAIDDDPAVIAERVRKTLDEQGEVSGTGVAYKEKQRPFALTACV